MSVGMSSYTVLNLLAVTSLSSGEDDQDAFTNFAFRAFKETLEHLENKASL